MLNIPGTLFIARKKMHYNNNTVVGPGFVQGWSVPLNRSFLRNHWPHKSKKLFIPYGDSIVLLNFGKVKNGRPHDNKFIYELKALWNDKFVYIYGRARCFDRWFALPKTWEKNGHPSTLKTYKQNGLYEKLNELIEKKFS